MALVTSSYERWLISCNLCVCVCCGVRRSVQFDSVSTMLKPHSALETAPRI